MKKGISRWVISLVGGAVGPWAQSIRVEGNVAFTLDPPAIPGNPPQMVFESPMGGVVLDMDGGPPGQGGTVWYVTVQKSVAGWHESLTLEVRRDPSRTDVIDGQNYVTIPNSPTAAYFFRSNNRRRVFDLRLQHRVTMGSLLPAGTYTTTVTYTIILGTP